MKQLILSVIFILMTTGNISAQAMEKEAMQEDGIIRLSHIEVYPEYLAEYLEYAKQVGEISLSTEPGVLSMYAVQEKDNPCHITILETYASQEAYRKHIASDHFQHYKQGTLKMVKDLKLVDQTAVNERNVIKNYIDPENNMESNEARNPENNMPFKELITSRYSCRKYDSARQISDARLNAILEAGRLAPTAKNLQEQHIYVAQSAEALAKIDSATPCRYGAPTVLVVAFDKNNVYTYPDGKRNSGIEDAAIVATHLMLAAANEGVNSCWVNFVQIDQLHEALGLPENEEILMLLDLGFAAPGAAPSPNHTSRKPLTDTVTKL
jgi:nitroreductase/quinol monooxygenase YgiN